MGNLFLPSRPGMGLRAEPAMTNSHNGSTPQPHAMSPQAFGENIGLFWACTVPCVVEASAEGPCAAALMATGIIWVKTQWLCPHAWQLPCAGFVLQ